MQASFIEVPIPENDMPLNDADRAWIRETIQNAHKAHGMGVLKRFIKEWSGTGAAVAIILFVLTQWTAYVEFRTTTNTFIQATNQKLTTIEGKLQLSSVLSAITNSVQYARNGDVDLAITSAEQAHTVLRTATDSKIPAPPEFFRYASDEIDSVNPKQVELSQKLNQLSTALAAYKSAINEVPSSPKQVSEFPRGFLPLTLSVAMYPDRTTILLRKNHTLSGYGAWLDCRNMKPGQEILKPDPQGEDANTALIKGITFVGATQTLDRLNLEDVTFVNTHIKYEGGPVRLLRVRFVGCTFDSPPDSSKGNRFNRYAILEPKTEFQVGE